ncbi:MAG: DUF1932 domain-containing protein [Dermatophilaceae bacterium]
MTAGNGGRVGTVAVLHPGRMGAAIAGQIRARGHTVLYLPDGRSDASRDRAEEHGMTAAASIAQVCREADIIISICPPTAAQDIAALVGRNDFDGIYLDANAINPARFPRIKDLLPSARAVVDGSILGPPPIGKRRTFLYLAGGDHACEEIAVCFRGSGVGVEILTQAAPAASALKMAYASYQKASRALAAVAHALAAEYGVTPQLLTEAERNPRSPLTDPTYLPSVAARAWRWVPELRDVAQTLTDAGLPAEQALAAAHVLQLWADDKDNSDLSVSQVLQQLKMSPPP